MSVALPGHELTRCPRTRALGLIGDSSVTTLLCAQTEAPDAGLVRLAAASAALGQIGDRRSIEPLLRMLRNDKLTDLSRAFAAVALGGVCDKDAMPWNTAYATHTNYRAATETLTDGQSGILDIL
jgi:HEAT repeat protein